MKKIISLAVAFAMIFGVVAAVSMSASAATVDGTLYKFNAKDYHYGWGECPETIEYSEGGYVTISDTRDHYTRQHQAFYPLAANPAAAKNIEAKVDLANAEYSGIIAIDMLIKQCSSSNYTIGEATTGTSGAQLNCIVEYKYKDPENYDEDLNPGAWTSMRFGRDGFVNFNQLTTFKIPVDGYLDYLEGADDPDLNYSDFQITAVQVHVMGYCFNAFKSEDPTYPNQAGIKDELVTFSPFYILDLGAPEEGENLGKGFEFVPNPTDEKDAGKFIIDGKEYAQDTETTQKDGLYGNRADIIRPTLQFGDVNEDGSVNAKDTLLMRKKVAKQNVTLNQLTADVIVDLTLNAKDVLQLRKFVAKQKVVLGEFTPKSEY